MGRESEIKKKRKKKERVVYCRIWLHRINEKSFPIENRSGKKIQGIFSAANFSIFSFCLPPGLSSSLVFAEICFLRPPQKSLIPTGIIKHSWPSAADRKLNSRLSARLNGRSLIVSPGRSSLIKPVISGTPVLSIVSISPGVG